MSSGIEIDMRPHPTTREETQRIGRHRKPEPELASPATPRPSWANEHAQPVPLVVEPATEFIVYPADPPMQVPGLPLAARKEGAALHADMTRPLRPQSALLGQLLQGARWVFGLGRRS